jgi:hypothetical protein
VKRAVYLILLIGAGGAGGALGSMIGAAFGKTALFAGGVVGGIIATPIAVVLAGWFRLIDRAAVKPAAIGATLGFLAAATIAVNTLSSPVGPILATTLVPIGGWIGERVSRRSSR